MQKKYGYGKIIKDWIIRSESLQLFVYNKPFGMSRKYKSLRTTFRDYNHDALLDKDDCIVQTATD